MYGSGVSTTSSPPWFAGSTAPFASRTENATGPSAFPLRSGCTGDVGNTPSVGAASSVCHH